MQRCCGISVNFFVAVLLIGCGGGGGGDAPPSPPSQQPPTNTSPVAIISLESEVIVAGSWVELSGSASSDADGDALSFTWSLDKPNESFAILHTVDEQHVRFEPDGEGPFVVYLELRDVDGAVDTASYTINARLPVPESLAETVATAPPEPSLRDRQDAARFLSQATFGPRDGEIELLLTEGVDTWFEEQLSMEPKTYLAAWQTIADEFGDVDTGENANFVQLSHETFMFNALYSPDQLRQRMTYALSQLFVISDRFDFGGHDQLMMGYADTLHQRAFGNFRDLLRAVTLHPAMGMFLAMLGNQKADVERNIRPDENFAREVMQLFTIGLQRLNQDGSPVLNDLQEPVQTYSPVDVQNYAAALTGWYFAGQADYAFGNTFHSIPWDERTSPMTPYEAFHQKTQKKLLRNYYVPAGATASQSLETVLDSLFFHPNLGPFVVQHLIKGFVTSNPSPEYIARVTAVFNRNEHGERGDLASVLQAILFDEEARRALHEQPAYFGRVKDPLLKFVNFNRLFKVSSYLEHNLYLANRPSQTFLGAPSVFNFYSPYHTPNRLFAEQGLVAPELQVLTAETIVNDASNYAYVATRELMDFWHDDEVSDPTSDHRYYAVVHDISPILSRLNGADVSAVIDFLDEYMVHGQFTRAMKERLINDVAPQIEHALHADYFGSELARTAHIHSILTGLIYQVALLPEFAVQR